MASSDSSSGVPPSGDGGAFELPVVFQYQSSLHFSGQEKQKMLLSSDHGHFSMVKSVYAISSFARLNSHSTGPCILPI
jgi:CDP-diacylglycerol--serine O-phosphatidyltransferase